MVPPHYPTTAIFFGPFLKDGLEFVQKSQKPFPIRWVTLSVPIILLSCQLGCGAAYEDFFVVLLLVGLTILGICGQEVAKEERRKFLEIPRDFDKNVPIAIQAATESGLGFWLTHHNWKLFQEFSEGKFASGIVFLVFGGLASVAATSTLSDQSQRRYSVANNMGAHLTECFTNGFKTWADAVQLGTGLVQAALSVMHMIVDFQEIREKNESLDPSEEELR